MTTTVRTTYDPSLDPGREVGRIFEVVLDLIDRDPDQPRDEANVDAELEGSFRAHGWFPDEPMRIRAHPIVPDRFMLMNGERRLTGARAAGLKKGLAVLVTEAEIEAEEAKRLAQQILSNEGKPLTYLERARGIRRFQQQLPKDKQGVVAVAKELGLAKSTVGDALALFEIPSCWYKLIGDGQPLGPAHVPVIRKWAGIPEKFHVRALETIKDDYRWTTSKNPRDLDDLRKGEKIHVREFEDILADNLIKFCKPLSEVPGYKGPTAKLKAKQYPWPVKVLALDPSIWQPIFNRRVADKRKKNKVGTGERAKQQAAQKAAATRYENEQAREQLEVKAFDRIRPLIDKAIIEQLRTAPVGLFQGNGAGAQFLLQDAENRNNGWKVEAKDIATPEALVRTCVTLMVLGNIDLWQWRHRNTKAKKLLRRFNLDVDIEKLLKGALAEAEEKEEAKPAAKK